MTNYRLLPLIISLTMLIATSSYAAINNNAFIVEMASEAKTIGDIRPVFIVYKDKELPKVTIKYVLKKYIQLFEKAQSPSVKIDALNRINNLRVKYNITGNKFMIDKIKQSEAVLESYSRIIDSDISYQRLDELIYQTAKANSFMGNDKESIKRLKLLVGLYPDSVLVDESMFRMGESYFNLEQFSKAEASYKKVLAFSKEETFFQQSRFKLAWSIFKQKRYLDAAKTALQTLDEFPALLNAINYQQVAEVDKDLVEDTLRLLAITFSKQGNSSSIEALQKNVSHQRYAYLLYDALFRFYLSQDRYEDSALVASAYTVNYPNDFNAYRMAINTIKTYKKGQFDIKEWAAKESFVAHFGINSTYWASLSTEQINTVKPLLTKYLNELAHLYYVRMQNSLKLKPQNTDYKEFAQQSSNYYLELASTRPNNKENAQFVYLAAEAINTYASTPLEYARVVELYEQAAYAQRQHSISPAAGYAAILGYEKLKPIRDTSKTNYQETYREQRQQSIERYAKFFPYNPYTPVLLNDLANELFTAKDFDYAQSVASRVIGYTDAKPSILYSSGLVNAHSLFELQKYSLAEPAYQRTLAFNNRKDRAVLRERLAATIYKQAELETSFSLSADLYLKVVDIVPESKIVPQALYDASSQLLRIKDWNRAIATLSHFQSAYSSNILFDDASEKLIYAYTENGEYISAAEKLVAVSNKTNDPGKASNYLYRAADLYFENGFEYEAVRLYEQFVHTYGNEFGLSIEAHQIIIAFNESSGNKVIANTWKNNLISYEKKDSSKRTDRSAFLASDAALSLAMLEFDVFERYKLTLPLKKSLMRKKKLLKSIVKRFESLLEYDVAEVVSASTYQIGQIYRVLAQDLMTSERPNSLTELQLEQYDILLEEQAYPFEEQALNIYQINIAKVADGQFDKWIKQTYIVLAEMNPTEYKRQFKEVSYASDIY